MGYDIRAGRRRRRAGAAAALAAGLALIAACGALPPTRPAPAPSSTPAGGIVVVVVTDTPPPAPLVPTAAPPRAVTASPAPTACQPAATILTGARLRAGPGTAYETLAIMPAGADVRVTARDAGADWLQVVYEGIQGWVSASLADAACLDGAPVISAPPPTAPPAPPTTAPPPAPADFNLRADSPTLAQGQCTAIRWNVNNVEAVYFFDGQAYQGVGGNDSRSVCPAATTTYRLRVQLNNGAIVEQAIVVTVVGQPPPSISFTVDHASLSQGQCTMLRWSVANAQAVTLRDGPNENLVGPDGPVQICPNATNTYVLRVSGRDGRQYQQTIVVTVTAAPRSIHFQASPQTLAAGGCALVSWAVAGDIRDNQVLIQLGGAYQTQPPNGSVTFCPPSSAAAAIEVTWSDGRRDTRSVGIQVISPTPVPLPTPIPLPAQAGIAANPTRISRGQCALVSWQVTGSLHGQIILRTGQGGGSFDRPVGAQGQETLCPTATTVYTLLGVWADGSRFERAVRIEVEGTVEPR